MYRSYNSSATPNKAIPRITTIITAYCALLSFSLRKMRDNITEKMLYEAISGAAIIALLDIANT